MNVIDKLPQAEAPEAVQRVRAIWQADTEVAARKLAAQLIAVFAESEVVGLLTRSVRRQDIARAVHQAILRRTDALLHRVSATSPLVFAGGGARNTGLTTLLGETLRQRVLVPDDPQAVGALGAALLAAEQARPAPVDAALPTEA